VQAITPSKYAQQADTCTLLYTTHPPSRLVLCAYGRSSSIEPAADSAHITNPAPGASRIASAAFWPPPSKLSRTRPPGWPPWTPLLTAAALLLSFPVPAAFVPAAGASAGAHGSGLPPPLLLLLVPNMDWSMRLKGLLLVLAASLWTGAAGTGGGRVNSCCTWDRDISLHEAKRTVFEPVIKAESNTTAARVVAQTAAKHCTQLLPRPLDLGCATVCVEHKGLRSFAIAGQVSGAWSGRRCRWLHALRAFSAARIPKDAF
jgi:hypothetical protein